MKKLPLAVLRRCCLAMAVMLIGLCLPVGAKEQTRKKDYQCTIRERPSFDGADIGAMAEGTAVTVLGQAGEFYQIDCYDMEGYVAKEQVEEKEGRFYIRCDPRSGETEIMTYTPAGQALRLRHSLLALAKKQVGKPYIYGSSGPYGFDCSGLTSYLYFHHDMAISRRASLQMADGIIVAREGLQVGDLLFFKVPQETALTSHVGIYVGDNRMIHAGSEGVRCVELTGEYFDGCFQCARRIVCTETASFGGGMGAFSVGLMGLG